MMATERIPENEPSFVYEDDEESGSEEDEVDTLIERSSAGPKAGGVRPRSAGPERGVMRPSKAGIEGRDRPISATARFQNESLVEQGSVGRIRPRSASSQRGEVRPELSSLSRMSSTRTKTGKGLEGIRTPHVERYKTALTYSKDRDSLIVDMKQLKQKYNATLEENYHVKSRNERLTHELARKEKQIESILREKMANSNSSSQASRYEMHIKENAFVRNLKKTIGELKKGLKERDAEIVKLRNDRKFTRMQQAQLEAETYFAESMRLQRVIDSHIDENRRLAQLLNAHIAQSGNVDAPALRTENEKLRLEIQELERKFQSLPHREREIFDQVHKEVTALRLEIKAKSNEMDLLRLKTENDKQLYEYNIKSLESELNQTRGLVDRLATEAKREREKLVRESEIRRSLERSTDGPLDQSIDSVDSARRRKKKERRAGSEERKTPSSEEKARILSRRESDHMQSQQDMLLQKHNDTILKTPQKPSSPSRKTVEFNTVGAVYEVRSSDMISEDEAATMIQSQYRGHQARKNVGEGISADKKDAIRRFSANQVENLVLDVTSPQKAPSSSTGFGSPASQSGTPGVCPYVVGDVVEVRYCSKWTTGEVVKVNPHTVTVNKMRGYPPAEKNDFVFSSSKDIRKIDISDDEKHLHRDESIGALINKFHAIPTQVADHLDEDESGDHENMRMSAKEFAEREEEVIAAVKIQSGFRGMQARNELERERALREERRRQQEANREKVEKKKIGSEASVSSFS